MSIFAWDSSEVGKVAIVTSLEQLEAYPSYDYVILYQDFMQKSMNYGREVCHCFINMVTKLKDLPVIS